MVNSIQARELISNNNISLEEAYLVIIDDCHYSTVKNHPLHKVNVLCVLSFINMFTSKLKLTVLFSVRS